MGGRLSRINRKFLKICKNYYLDEYDLTDLEECLDSGADINARNIFTGEGALTLLVMNCEKRSSKCVKFMEFLIDRKIKVDLIDDRGSTPLKRACNRPYIQAFIRCINILLKAGADPNYRCQHPDYDFRLTPMMRLSVRYNDLLLNHRVWGGKGDRRKRRLSNLRETILLAIKSGGEVNSELRRDLKMTKRDIRKIRKGTYLSSSSSSPSPSSSSSTDYSEIIHIHLSYKMFEFNTNSNNYPSFPLSYLKIKEIKDTYPVSKHL